MVWKVPLAALAAAVAVLSAAPPPALAGPPGPVTVRVEGAASTLLPRTAVTTTTVPAAKGGAPGQACSGTSGVGALDRAANGNWDGNWTFGSQAVETILGERHAFDANAVANRYWSFWRNYEFQNVGACDVELQPGDDVLWFVDCFGQCTSPKPLRVQVPATVAPGAVVEARVTEYTGAYTPSGSAATSAAPAAGATVASGGQRVTTGPDGVARLTFAERGPHDVQATRADAVRSAVERVCVTDGADGSCGTGKPGEPAPASPAAPCATDGADGRCGTRDRRAPQATITNIREQQRFARRRAPRVFKGLVEPDPSGLLMVKLRLTRQHRGHCWGYSSVKERFVRRRCGVRHGFRIGDRNAWSYLLPSRLKPGRYVLDAIAIDRAYNHDTLARGRNRVVFHVR